MIIPGNWDLVEEPKHVVQLRLEFSEGCEQVVLVTPQQLSHRAGGEESHTQRPHVGGHQAGNESVRELLHHRLQTSI